MKLILYFLIVIVLYPVVAFSMLETGKCSQQGYTIATINGVLTDEEVAKGNMRALRKIFGSNYNNQVIDYQYLLNPTHMGGISDIFGAISQKAFENETVVDYDLIEMLKGASKKVKTQKLLLVAHSQGNFYANSFYDVVTTQAGGVPAQSIGVYSVATPSGRVVDSGTRWLTSETDKVIAWVVGNVPFRNIMTPNVRIELHEGDNIAGHGFSDAYLKYSSKRIVEDIQYSLNRLSKNNVQNEGNPCISSSKNTVSHKVQGLLLAVADPAGSAVAWILGTGIKVTTFAYNATEAFAKWGSHMEAVAIMWTYHTAVAVAVWSYDTAITVAKTAWGIASTIGSFAYNVLTGVLSNSQLANNNSASVILAAIPVQDLSIANVTDNNAITIDATASVENQSGVADTQQQPQTVFVFEPRVQTVTDMPKLVFVGSFSSSGGSPTQQTQQILGTQTTAPVVEEVVATEEKAVNAGVAMATPALSAPQCSQTLATDGCLLATTTVRFEWSDIAEADHYLINKNGDYATTTDTIFDTEIKDFSDYIFEVVAVGTDGIGSATSTQAVSVATIPIAINEIAWMGTKANTSDEWFEIKNNTGHTIDLSQWELNAKDGTPHVKLTGTISPHAYLIFERTDDTAVKDVDGETYGNGGPQFALSNSGDQLILFHASTTFDQTPEITDGVWAAGENSSTTKKTMERYSSRESGTDPENWGTNLGYIKNGTDAKDSAIEGTPGAQNSVSTLINKGWDITSDFTLTADEERYVVPEDNILVSASTTLTVAPGVEINFYNNGRLLVNGILDTQGTSENPVTFRSFDDATSGAIVFWNATGTSTIDYTNIENTRGLIASGGNTTVEIYNTEFSGNATSIELYNGAHVSLASSTIKDTFYSDAIGVYNSTMIIASSTISNTIEGDAIGAYYSNVTIASSTISDTLDGDAIGVYYSTMTISSTTIDGAPDRNGIFSYKSVLDIENSTIRNTESDAIVLSNSTSTISNTIVEAGAINEWGSGIYVSKGTATITDTSVSGFADGSGISVYEPTLPVTISGGEITGNAIGIDVYPDDSAIITDVLVHDNGTSEEDNVVVW